MGDEPAAGTLTVETTRHSHTPAIISHTHDKTGVLVTCTQCHKTEIYRKTSSALRIKVAERCYRPLTDEEFVTKMRTFRHLCCKKPKADNQ